MQDLEIKISKARSTNHFSSKITTKVSITSTNCFAMEQSIFQAHPEIIEKLFSALDPLTLLNCRLVCKTWNQFLENPTFWLKKLKEVGQPEEIETAWKNLIAKAEEIEVENFARCLRMKFTDFILAPDEDDEDEDDEDEDNANKEALKYPPLYTAAYYGHLEIVKLIYQLGEDFNRKIYWNVKYHSNYYVMPIFAAVENSHTEVAKFFIETLEEELDQLMDYHGNTLLHSAIENQNLELVKFLVSRTPNLSKINKMNQGYSLLHAATIDYEIFKYIVSLPGIDPNANMKHKNLTPLHMLCRGDYMYKNQAPPGDVTKMINILAPLADKNFLYSKKTDNPLHLAAGSGALEALKALLNFFDANVVDRVGQLPIECAIENNEDEAVAILAPFTKELKMKNHWKRDKKLSNAVKVLQSFIDERQPPQKKIRVEVKEYNLYELSIDDKNEVYTKDQIKTMIHLFNMNQKKNSLEGQCNHNLDSRNT